MTVGWYQASDALWYYTSEVSDGNLGMLIKGWHKDGQDGKWYFLDRRDRNHAVRLAEIDGKVIILPQKRDIPGQTWIFGKRDWKMGSMEKLGINHTA